MPLIQKARQQLPRTGSRTRNYTRHTQSMKHDHQVEVILVGAWDVLKLPWLEGTCRRNRFRPGRARSDRTKIEVGHVDGAALTWGYLLIVVREIVAVLSVY